MEQLKDWTEQGYMNTHVPLMAAVKQEEDPCSDISNEAQYFIARLQGLMQTPHRQQCVSGLHTPPLEMQNKLKNILPGVL